eukprot:Opistho-2@263
MNSGGEEEQRKFSITSKFASVMRLGRSDSVDDDDKKSRRTSILGSIKSGMDKVVSKAQAMASPESKRMSIRRAESEAAAPHVEESFNPLATPGFSRQMSGSNVLATPKAEILCRVRVKRSFSPTAYDTGSLVLKVGDIIDVTQKDMNGVWTGILDGRMGVFKVVFVEFVDEAPKGEVDTPANPPETS